ncbi:hypothetical protein AVEN_31475-1 [Araneus ventricosus]|uniref:Uncharacterized protein n=1 Tax=Araneus ventricosus TaxID=182803 RepID=A0A4Y2X9J6_ARAVE|nr:hypothetical protein AVEN_31475-1 [Araneus ventricosus]
MPENRRRQDRTPPHVPVPATITVTTPVGWTWDNQIQDRTPPHAPVPVTIEVTEPVEGHGTQTQDRTPPHVPVPVTIKVTEPVGWTWDSNTRQNATPCPFFFFLTHGGRPTRQGVRHYKGRRGKRANHSPGRNKRA